MHFDPYTGMYMADTPVNPRPRQGGIKWVQGEAGARAQNVMPGDSEVFLDSETPCFYIKSVDASGMPLPLRIFDYTERVVKETPKTDASIDMSKYVTLEELDRRLAALTAPQKSTRGGKSNAESAV